MRNTEYYNKKKIVEAIKIKQRTKTNAIYLQKIYMRTLRGYYINYINLYLSWLNHNGSKILI